MEIQVISLPTVSSAADVLWLFFLLTLNESVLESEPDSLKSGTEFSSLGTAVDSNPRAETSTT